MDEDLVDLQISENAIKLVSFYVNNRRDNGAVDNLVESLNFCSDVEISKFSYEDVAYLTKEELLIFDPSKKGIQVNGSDVSDIVKVSVPLYVDSQSFKNELGNYILDMFADLSNPQEVLNYNGVGKVIPFSIIQNKGFKPLDNLLYGTTATSSILESVGNNPEDSYPLTKHDKN